MNQKQGTATFLYLPSLHADLSFYLQFYLRRLNVDHRPRAGVSLRGSWRSISRMSLTALYCQLMHLHEGCAVVRSSFVFKTTGATHITMAEHQARQSGSETTFHQARKSSRTNAGKQRKSNDTRKIRHKDRVDGRRW